MTSEFQRIVDAFEHTVLSFDEIPRIQGFYLLFDENGHFIYVGKGWLDERVAIHFDPKQPQNTFFEEATYWTAYPTGNENEALKEERKIYDLWKKWTGLPPKRNQNVPEGPKNEGDFDRYAALQEIAAKINELRLRNNYRNT